MSFPDEVLQSNDERIEWLLAHPRISPWLKAALKGTRGRNPVEILYELEILNLLLRTECETKIQIAFPSWPADPRL